MPVAFPAAASICHGTPKYVQGGHLVTTLIYYDRSELLTYDLLYATTICIAKVCPGFRPAVCLFEALFPQLRLSGHQHLHMYIDLTRSGYHPHTKNHPPACACSPPPGRCTKSSLGLASRRVAKTSSKPVISRKCLRRPGASASAIGHQLRCKPASISRVSSF